VIADVEDGLSRREAARQNHVAASLDRRSNGSKTGCFI